jgi:hypothetical protein
MTEPSKKPDKTRRDQQASKGQPPANLAKET